MSLAALPPAVIARLRDQCPIFADRVAGTSGEARASDNTELAVPHGFYMPGGIELEEAQLSPLDQECAITFRVLVAVDNKADDRGQAGAQGLMEAVAEIVPALVGWVPAAGFAPCLFTGLEDEFSSNRDRLWGSLSFRTSIMSSNF